jgi:hypothetical protein
MGLSVVKESLGRNMFRCQLLACAHFIFGSKYYFYDRWSCFYIFTVLYSVGIVELSLESTSALVLLLFIIPLAFTLSGFLLWIMYSLNSTFEFLHIRTLTDQGIATITYLHERKQRYKLRMFKRLHYILMFVVCTITAFFVVSSLAFSGRLAEGRRNLTSLKI